MPVGATAVSMQEERARAGAELLATLQQAHVRLLAAMDVMDAVAREPVPDPARYTSARWRLSEASLARRAVWAHCSAHLSAMVDAEGAAALAVLRSTDMELQRCSAAHVARWSAAAIGADWRGYCSDSRAIRSKMASAVETEKRLLYPLLARYFGA